MTDEGQNLSEEDVKAVGDADREEATPSDQVREDLRVAFTEEWAPVQDGNTTASADLDDSHATGSGEGTQ